MRIAALSLLIFCFACTGSGPRPSDQAVASEPPLAPATPVHWKAVLIAGDDSIANFDRAVDRMDQFLVEEGVAERQLLTSSFTELGKGKSLAEPASIEAAFDRLHLQPGDGCFLFMTSHGNRSGFYLAQKKGYPKIWKHDDFADTLDKYCGNLPTVAIVSSCYSGGFIDDDTERPNRIILTAARRDRTSFGCSAETEYTYFDSCLVQVWPKSQTWEGLARFVRECVDEKERAEDFVPSEPQSSFGQTVKSLQLPHRS